MRIAFIGNHEPSFSTETHHRKTFEKMGHEVVQFQENKTSVAEIMKEAVSCQMLYYTHTHSWRIDSDEKIRWMFSELKRLGIPTVGYHLDLFVGIKREREITSDPYWHLEHFFSVDPQLVSYLNDETKTKAYYLPAGVFEDECKWGVPDRERYPHDVIFTGSGKYHAEYNYRPKLINWLHDTYGHRFAQYGSGGYPVIRGLELNNLYASAKVVIGDTLCMNFDCDGYFSDRAFEVPGRSGFMIFPHIDGIEDAYELGKEIVTYKYNDFVQLKELINYYLKHEVERENIREAGFHRVLLNHTYTVRLQYILDTLNLK